MDLYNSWEFKKDPFETTALPADDIGNDLIAGRDIDIEKFLKRLYNGSRIVTVEGDVGIGKTSIINVGVYRATLNYIENKSNSSLGHPNQLFFPCSTNFQIEESTDTDSFRSKVFREIAQTIIQHKDTFKNLKISLPLNINEVNNWLNNPQNNSYSASFGALTVQVGGGKNIQLNETNSFEQHGLEQLVKNWLLQMFPNNNGGIVCLIDNLELLKNSNSARQIIENLRDTLFTIKGIRWVICGSFGIVTSILSSPRIEGFLHEPIQIKGISTNYLKDIFDRRRTKYKKNDNCYLPISHSSFTILYEILKQNIRSTLRYTGEYCLWVSDCYKHPITKEEKDNLFLDWLIKESEKYKTEIEKELKPKTFELFKNFLIHNSPISFGDFENFGFTNLSTFKNGIKELEKFGIVATVMDENDNRRKSIEIMPKGLFISYAINTQESKKQKTQH